MRRRHQSASPYEESTGFSRAIRLDNRILVSGTAPIGPDGKTWAGDAAEQMRRCVAVVKEAVDALGGTLDDVVRTRTYLTRREDWEQVAAIHSQAFGAARPAATMVIVKSLLDPDWLVELEVEVAVQAA